MIPVSQAQAIISGSINALTPVKRPLGFAAAHTLAQDVYAQSDIPSFEQSSMDGYAIRFSDKDVPLLVVGELAAGNSNSMSIGAGETARIFTGAPLPSGADTVVMQEKIKIENGRITINDLGLSNGSNVRKKGTEVKNGELAMKEGTWLSPAAIGFLAGIGINEVLVYPMPAVSIIVTGRELQAPGTALLAAQVYESNSYSLSAALRWAGVTDISIRHADDDLSILKNELDHALRDSELVLLTGGVSVGDYDFVVKAAEGCEVEQKFHKVKQKPGKPLYFGMKGDKPVFGLPGNPSSVLSCFYNYVEPALARLSNRRSAVNTIEAVLGHTYSKTSGLTQFLKGMYLDGVATVLNAQESYRMSSFAGANCLIRLEEERSEYAVGEQVTVILIIY
jgi:molybdopterin molybdotransferase